MKKEKYFAYGSNMNKDRMIKRGINFYGYKLGVLKNYKLVFQKFLKEEDLNNNIFANIVPCNGCDVEGVIYETNNIKDLDFYEYTPRDYKRKKMSVICNEKKVSCHVYIGNNLNIGLEEKPKLEYLDNFFNDEVLSEEYLTYLKKFK